jgi:urea transport system permease protein
LYYVCVVLLLGVVALSSWILQSRLGRLLIALREKEERVRFTGYDTANLKVFAFVFAAVVSGIGGALFTLIVGFMSPSFVGIVPSIEIVIAAAVGGRQSLLGAIYGSLLVNYGKTFFSESLPELWLFLLGGLFILVVMAFPNGLAGLDVRRWLARVRVPKVPGLPRVPAPWPTLEAAASAPSQPHHEIPRYEVPR